MKLLWFIVLGLACYIAIVTLIDVLVAKFRKPKNNYFADLKKGGENLKIKRKYKYIALLLILSFLVPFVPSVHVSADGLAFMPEFPYGQDNYYNVNNGSFSLWQVHNSNYISYVQTFTPNNISYPNPIIIYNKAWLSSNDTYYLDYNYIIDSWDITGLHSDSFAGTQNIRIPKPNETYVSDNVVYATMLYTTDDIIWKNGDNVGVYAYTNFYPDGYADPTPTPIPLPAPLKAWNDYDNTDSFIFVVKCVNAPENSSYKVGHYYGINNGRVYYPSYANYINNSLLYDYDYYALLDKFVYSSSGSCDEVNYDIELNDYSSNGVRNLSVLGSDSTVDGFSLGGFPLRTNSIYKTFRSRNYSMNYNTFEGTDWVISNNLENKFGGYLFELVATNHSLSVNSFNNTGSNNIVPSVVNNSTPTPTPTLRPTAIPQPTDNPSPSPTTPPDIKVVLLLIIGGMDL